MTTFLIALAGGTVATGLVCGFIATLRVIVDRASVEDTL